MQLQPVDRAVIDRRYPLYGELERWTESLTVLPDDQYGPFPLHDGLVPVYLPDDYVGPFEVWLIAEDGTQTVACEGRRLPPLREEL